MIILPFQNKKLGRVPIFWLAVKFYNLLKTVDGQFYLFCLFISPSIHIYDLIHPRIVQHHVLQT
jgi:hypothetical protein